MPNNEDELLQNILQGHQSLVNYTKQDLGFKLIDWHNFLLAHEDFKRSSQFIYAWESVEKAILAEISNPDRIRIESLAVDG